jgi:hypothetical protein
VIEGPAGCGKSTLIEKLEHKGVAASLMNWDETIQLERPRSYEGDFGVMHSQLKDIFSIQRALYTWASGEDKPIMIDRFLLSQWVYGTIRQGLRNLNQQWGTKIILGGADLIGLSWDHFLSRLFVEPKSVGIYLLYWILVPEPGLLADLRANSGKIYPYDPYQEAFLYKEAAYAMLKLAEEIESDLVSPICLQVHGVSYRNLEDLDSLATRIELSYE